MGLGSGVWVWGLGFRIEGTGFRVSGFVRFSVFGFRVSNHSALPGLTIIHIERSRNCSTQGHIIIWLARVYAASARFPFQFWGLGCHVSVFWFRFSGFRFQVSGFGSRVSGFGFWVAGEPSFGEAARLEVDEEEPGVSGFGG